MIHYQVERWHHTQVVANLLEMWRPTLEWWLPYLLDHSHLWRSLQGEVAQTLGAPLLSSHSIKGRALSLVEGGKYCKDTLLELLWNIF